MKYIYNIRWYKQDCECMKGQKPICSVWWLPLDQVAKAKAKGKAKAKASAKAKAKTCCALDVVQVCSSKWIEMEGFKMFQLALPIGFLWSTHLLLKVFPIVFDAFRLIKPWNAEFEIGLCMPFWLWFLRDPEQLHKYSSILLKQMLSNGWQLQFIHVEMLAGQGKSLRLGVSRCVSVICVDWSWM